MTQGLAKRKILRGHGAFADILARGIAITAGSIRLFVVPSIQPGEQGVGFTVVRGIKKAAVRNRIKRCMREAFRLRQHEIRIKAGGMVLLYIGRAPKRSSEIDCTKIGLDVRAVLTRASAKEP